MQSIWILFPSPLNPFITSDPSGAGLSSVRVVLGTFNPNPLFPNGATLYCAVCYSHSLAIKSFSLCTARNWPHYTLASLSPSPVFTTLSNVLLWFAVTLPGSHPCNPRPASKGQCLAAWPQRTELDAKEALCTNWLVLPLLGPFAI